MKKLMLLLSVALLCSGCAGGYNVGVNGFTITGQRLEIPQVASVSIIEDSNAPNPFLEKEIAGKIRRLLNARGFSRRAEKPDYYVVFRYGIDSGRTVVGTMPIYEPGDFATIDTVGTRGGVAYSRYSTIYTPGYTTYVPYSATVYTRWLVLKLIEGQAYRSSEKVTPLWIGEITSVGADSDLRETINYMLIGAFDYFGENTGKRLHSLIRKSDKRVLALTQQ